MVGCNPPNPLSHTVRKKTHCNSEFHPGQVPAPGTRALGSAPLPPRPQHRRASIELAKMGLHALLGSKAPRSGVRQDEAASRSGWQGAHSSCASGVANCPAHCSRFTQERQLLHSPEHNSPTGVVCSPPSTQTSLSHPFSSPALYRGRCGGSLLRPRAPTASLGLKCRDGGRVWEAAQALGCSLCAHTAGTCGHQRGRSALPCSLQTTDLARPQPSRPLESLLSACCSGSGFWVFVGFGLGFWGLFQPVCPVSKVSKHYPREAWPGHALEVKGCCRLPLKCCQVRRRAAVRHISSFLSCV